MSILYVVCLLGVSLPFTAGDCGECAICTGVDIDYAVHSFMKYLGAASYDEEDFDGDGYYYRDMEPVSKFKNVSLANQTLMDMGTDCSKSVGTYDDHCFVIEFIRMDEKSSYAETRCTIMTRMDNMFNYTLDPTGNLTEDYTDRMLDDFHSQGFEVMAGLTYYPQSERAIRFAVGVCDPSDSYFTDFCSFNYSSFGGFLDTRSFAFYAGDWMDNYDNTSSQEYMELADSVDLVLLEMYKKTWGDPMATSTDGKTRLISVMDKDSMAKVEFEVDLLLLRYHNGVSFTDDELKYVYKMALTNAKTTNSSNTYLPMFDSRIKTSLEMSMPAMVKVAGFPMLNASPVLLMLATVAIFQVSKFFNKL